MRTSNAQRVIQRKLRVLAHAVESRNVSKTCRYFGISRDTFYEWKKAFKIAGEPGLIYRKRGPRCNLARRVPSQSKRRYCVSGGNTTSALSGSSGS